MTEFKVHKLRMPSGEIVPLRQTLNGQIVCPVCGWIGDGDSPWGDERIDLSAPLPATGNAHGSFDICPCCKTQYGWDDAVGSESPHGVVERWARLREDWLQRVGRSREALEQLKNLDLTEAPNKILDHPTDSDERLF